MENDSSSRMLLSTMQKSISVPQVRSNGLRNAVSTSSVRADFASTMSNKRENVGGTSSHWPGIETIESATNNVRVERHVHFSDNLSPAVCRICHGGEVSCPFNKGEPLISPCHCSGSMGLYHRSCLEKWLSTSNSDKCEICKFQYMVERVPKPWTEFLRNPGGRSIRRNMVGDILCLCILTPMAFASCWLCVAGAIAVAGNGGDAVAVPGLISLAVFLLLTYFVWLSVSLRYHFQVWREWRNRNQTVHLIALEERSRERNATLADDEPDANNNASPRELIPLQPLADIPGHRSTDTNATASDSPWARTNRRRISSPFAFEYPNPGFVWDTAV